MNFFCSFHCTLRNINVENTLNSIFAKPHDWFLFPCKPVEKAVDEYNLMITIGLILHANWRIQDISYILVIITRLPYHC